MFRKIIIPVLLVFLLVLGGLILYKSKYSPNKNELSTITPTAVPTLSLSPTTINKHSNWKNFTDTSQNISFQYPDSLSTTYIHTQNWPPKITVTTSNFSCKESNYEAGQTMVTQKTTNHTVYCITTVSQGAAGTVYVDYTYTLVKKNKLVTIQFTLAYPQCDNYTEPKKTECTIERQTFNLDNLVNQIAQTVSF